MKLVKLRSRTLSLLLGLMLAAVVSAQPQRAEEARRAQVNTATATALERLREEIVAARINRGLTVEEFVHQTDSAEELKQALQRARQIGGPRWIDDQTCQVQLEISGAQVAEALVRIAESKPDRSPMPAEALARELKGWKDRSFTATGTSSSPLRLEVLRPLRANDWERVSDDIRTRAVHNAHQDAARRALESVRPVELTPGLTVADAMARPDVAQRMNQWFGARPIKSVSFKEDLQVDLTLGAPAEEAFDELVEALQASGDVNLQEDQRALHRARDEFVQRMAEPVGRATVTRDAIDLEPQPIEIPAQAPDWINHQIDAEGTAQAPRGRPLAGMQAAQERALQNLRAKVGALPLTDRLSIDDAARKDARIARAIDMAMVRARVFKVDHDAADGSTTVRMMLDPRDVWEEIARAR